MSELVSIIIPTFKRLPMLKQALDSCFKQTYPNIEVVVVDDADTDETENYLRELADPRVVYVRKPVGTGMMPCFNAGFARSKGDYLTWLCDDDYYAPEAIATMVKAFGDDPLCDFVYSHYWVVDEQGKIIRPGRVEDPEGLDRDNYVGHCFLYRRKVYETIGDYRKEDVLVEDYEYWLRVRRKFNMKRIPQSMCYHRMHGDCLTIQHGPDQMLDAVARLRRRFVPIGKHLFFAGELYYHRKKRLKGVGAVVMSLALRPWYYPAWRLLALLVLPARIVERIRSVRRRANLPSENAPEVEETKTNRLVTIVIPTCNRRVLLEQSVESCLRQTYPYFEIIIVDDASSDNTAEYVEGLKDPRVVYIRKPSQGGSVSSLNLGFARAKGEYLTWSSDDDYYAPEAIARLAEALRGDQSADFVYAHYWMVDRDGKILNAARVEDPASLDRDNYVGHCFLYRRKVYEVIGDYHAEAFLAEDYEYWLRVREQFRMKRIPTALYYHRIHSDSLTIRHGVEKVQDAVAQARRPFIPFWKHHFFTGERYYHASKRLRAAGHILLSIIFRPWHGPSWRLLILIILPSPAVARIRGRRPRVS